MSPQPYPCKAQLHLTDVSAHTCPPPHLVVWGEDACCSDVTVPCSLHLLGSKLISEPVKDREEPRSKAVQGRGTNQSGLMARPSIPILMAGILRPQEPSHTAGDEACWDLVGRPFTYRGDFTLRSEGFPFSALACTLASMHTFPRLALPTHVQTLTG